VVAAATFLAASAVTPADCGRCHDTHYQEWRQSAHARATRSPLYRTLEGLHRADRARAGQRDDRRCAACHGDTADGVDCLTCHATAAILEAAPGRAGMKAGEPGTYYGPIDRPADARVHRSRASALHRDERICAPCHDHDADGTPCCTVLRDWRAWEMADFQTCQSCHMRAVAGRRAARDGPSRTVHRHRFPGSDDIDQLRSGWHMEVKEATAGRAVNAAVAVTNRAAHALPNGEPYAARVILRAEAVDGRGRVLASEERGYGFAMLDAAGAPTVLQSHAARRGRSTALRAAESRLERFRLDAGGAAAIVVTLWHVPFEPPREARGWADALLAWMAKEKPDWHEMITSLRAPVEARARPRLFARVSRSLASAAARR
jgi:hypothetical protein